MSQDPLPAFTPADIDALPEGPFRAVTTENPDWLARVPGAVRWKQRADCPPGVARFYGPDDPVYHYDSEGDRYTAGQWGDGTWYKQRWMFP